MNTHNSKKISAITLLVAAIFSPISSMADQPKNPVVINISGPAITSQSTNTQYKFKKKKISFTLGLQ